MNNKDSATPSPSVGGDLVERLHMLAYGIDHPGSIDLTPSDRKQIHAALKEAAAEIERLSRPAAEVAGEPVAWRLRVGDSDSWGYCNDEEQAEFYGSQSGLRYIKEPLYLSSAPVARDGVIEECAKVCDELAAPHDEDARMRPYSNGYYSAASQCASSIRALKSHSDVGGKVMASRILEACQKFAWIECPKCGASGGNPCRSPSFQTVNAHSARRKIEREAKRKPQQAGGRK